MELGGAARTVLHPFVQRCQDAEECHLPPEISLVEWPAKHGLVHPLQLTESEFFRQQLEADGGVFKLVREAFESVSKNLLVIERQGGCFRAGIQLAAPASVPARSDAVSPVSSA